MLGAARARLAHFPAGLVEFRRGDALEALPAAEPWDVILSTWVLGYIPLEPFFALACRNLSPGGSLLFLVHTQNTPREPLEIFTRLALEEPGALIRPVGFDFPVDLAAASRRVQAAGLAIVDVWQGALTFRCASERAALDHLLGSGAGTAYYEAVAPSRREALTRRFEKELAQRHPAGPVEVIHDYIGCVARKPSGTKA